MISFLQLAYVIALRRTLSNWKLELVLFLGMVLAVSLMSSGVIFSDLLEEAALRRTLDQATPEQANFTVRTYNGLEDPRLVSEQASIYLRGIDTVERYVSGPFQPYIQDQALLFQTLPFFFAGHPQLELPDNIRPRGRISHMTGLFPDRAEIVEGRWPYSGGPVSLDEPLEIAIDVAGGELIQLATGDEMEIFLAVNSASQTSIKVKIVGLFQRVDPEAEFWYGVSRTFSHTEDRVAIVPLFTTEDAILEYVGRSYPGSYTDVKWFFYLNRSEIRAGDVGPIQDTIQQAEDDIRRNLENASTAIRLDDVLSDYQQQILLARIPLYLMISLTTGILIYYLALVTSLVVKSRSAETSILKSRGITSSQMGLLALVEGLLLAAPAVVLGPLLAMSISRTLGSFFIDMDVGSGAIPVPLSPQAFLLGAAGALLAVTVLTVSTLIASRQGMIEFRQSGARPPRAPFIHRSYLDILALVLIGLIWWQIQTRGSFLVRSLGTGELEVDISLLLGPLLGLLALGLLVMRFFPLAVSLVARITESVGPVWLVQGLRRVSRDPIMPGALVVLLMLTTSLGVIGSTFSSTIERSQRDRALYDSGADLRIQHSVGRAPISLLGMSNLTQRLEGVETISEVLRTTGTITTGAFDQTTVTIMAVNTDNFADAAWYREDFTDGNSLLELTQAINPNLSVSILDDGITLPPYATNLTLWVNPGAIDPGSSLMGRVRDAGGFYFDIPFGQLDFEGWRLDSQGWIRLDADLFPIRNRRSLPLRVNETGWLDFLGAVPPFTLISLRVNMRTTTSREPGAIFLGDLSVITPFEETHLGDFQAFLDGWHVVEDYDVPGLFALEPSEAVARPGTRGSADNVDNDAPPGQSARLSTGSAALTWVPGGLALPSIRVGKPEVPIPAIVSRSLLDIVEARLGDTFTVGTIDATVPIQVVAIADYFPTLNPREEPFIVMDLRTLNHYTNLHGQGLVGGSNEMWISMASMSSTGADPAAALGAMKGFGINMGETFIAAEMVSQRVDQPLVNAGWSGLLILMFLALVLASASGVMLFSYTDTRERHTEFALLRTLGFSRGQLNGVVWFNLLLVVICGIGLGTWAGQQIGISVLPILEVAEEGVRVTPPMVLQINWGILLGTYLVLTLVSATAVVWLAWITNRLDVQQVLRIGEA
jgi:ABC-type antimicrobial peptide transport system permease subunit